MILAVTGHRPTKLLVQDAQFKEELAARNAALEANTRAMLKWALNSLGAQQLITGMALGVDQWAAEEAIALKLPFIAAIPCRNQDRFWGHEAQKRYSDLMKHAARVTYVTEKEYEAGCMQLRNEWMVNHAHMVVAVFDGTAGGTANCVRYALEQKRRVFRYNPKTNQSEWLGV
jgi:uncharacterized phage-like protein YoqJ